jgi:Tfp pilus assembly protein PilF
MGDDQVHSDATLQVEDHYHNGLERLESGDMHGAVEEFREAVRLHPSDVHSRQSLADALNDWGEPENAIKEYEEAIRLNPDSRDCQTFAIHRL